MSCSGCGDNDDGNIDQFRIDGAREPIEQQCVVHGAKRDTERDRAQSGE